MREEALVEFPGGQPYVLSGHMGERSTALLMPEEPLKVQAGIAAEPALLHQRIFPPYKIATLVEAADERGIGIETALAGTGLAPDHVRDPNALTSIADYIGACGNIIAAGGDLSLAHDVGSRLHLSAYRMYGYALMCSPTVRDFFDFAVRYHELAMPMLHLGWRQEGDLAIWQFTETYHSVMSRSVRDFLVRQQLMMTVTHVRDVTGAGVLPVRALIGLPSPDSAAQDASALGCPCQFDTLTHELHYPASLLTQTLRLSNRLTHQWLEETCKNLIAQPSITSGLSAEIHQLLMRATERPISMESIAQQRGMTERTLRRRLERENTRFADIVDDVRKRRALEYVQTTRMSADDIALKLGFSDSSNLRRAIKRWTGRPMGELRHR